MKPLGSASFSLEGKTYQGKVFDADAIAILSILYLDSGEQKQLAEGSEDEAFKTFRDRQRQEIQILVDQGMAQPKAEELANERSARAIFHRINMDAIARKNAALRFLEMFPELEPHYVQFIPTRDQGVFRMDAVQISNMIGAVLVAILEMAEEDIETGDRPPKASTKRTTGSSKETTAKKSKSTRSKIVTKAPVQNPTKVQEEIAKLSPAARQALGLQEELGEA